MVNENLGSFDDINTGEIREDQNKVTEDAVKRIQDDSKQAQQVAQQIQDDKAKNNKLADFLTFLLQEITDQTLISSIFNTFFKIQHPNQDIEYLRKNPNILVIVGLFIPFYPAQIEQFQLQDMYAPLYDFSTEINLEKYITYIKTLSKTYHDNIPLDQKHFLEFLITLTDHYGLSNTKENTDTYNAFKQTLTQELYG